MRIFVVGTGGVGAAVASVAARRRFFGVLGPEAFPAAPFLELLADYGAPHGSEEREP